ncbi:MAG: hypothetical protein RBR16_13475 [Syntrophus sp. (in: bacteria)]|nr:hypothetical protein [Syntrophus sp. (in: bacteria)]
MKDKICPLPGAPGYAFETCSERCAWRVGEDCAIALLGKLAQSMLLEVERQEILADSKARRA